MNVWLTNRDHLKLRDRREFPRSNAFRLQPKKVPHIRFLITFSHAWLTLVSGKLSHKSLADFYERTHKWMHNQVSFQSQHFPSCLLRPQIK